MNEVTNSRTNTMPKKGGGSWHNRQRRCTPERAPFDTAQARPSRRSHQRLQELHELIARRAYEIFESKCRAFGRDPSTRNWIATFSVIRVSLLRTMS